MSQTIGADGLAGASCARITPAGFTRLSPAEGAFYLFADITDLEAFRVQLNKENEKGGGAKLTIKASSAKGTATVDTYSLKGLSDALARVAQECK